jgi:hypothetical protein
MFDPNLQLLSLHVFALYHLVKQSYFLLQLIYALLPVLIRYLQNPSDLQVLAHLRSFFQSEISKGQDVFVEFTNRYNVPEFPDRTLYRWRFNPHFEEEYEKTAEEDPTKVRYLIPIDELKVVKSYSPAAVIKPAETEFEFSLPNPEKDPLISELTIRDLAAILLQKPVSNKEWLNNIIKNK